MQISSRAVMFWDFQLHPKIFYGVEIWRLARPLQDLEMLLTKPLLRCPGGVFGIIVMLKDPATFHLQCPCWWKEVFTQNLTIHGPIHLSFTQISHPGPFAEKQPQSMMFPPPCFTVGMVFFGCNSAFFLLQIRQVSFYKKLYFGFIWPYDILPILFWIIQMLSSKLQTGLDMYWLKAGGHVWHCRIWVPDGAVCYWW